MATAIKQPSLFVAHGAPLLAIQQDSYTACLESYASRLPQRPKAIVSITAHWDAPGQLVSRREQNGTYHDFGGFPDELYRLRYDAPGDPALSDRIGGLLQAAGVQVTFDDRRGLDHGTWVPLLRMFPDADIPVVALSVHSRATPEQQYAIGRALETLREDNILVIASGGLVHNFSYIEWQRGMGVAEEGVLWSMEFDEWIRERVEAWQLDDLFAYETRAPHASKAVPPHAREHFVPLFYAMGAADSSRLAQRTFQAYQVGTLSLNIYEFQ